jgi:predicted transcriptional regulator
MRKTFAVDGPDFAINQIRDLPRRQGEPAVIVMTATDPTVGSFKNMFAHATLRLVSADPALLVPNDVDVMRNANTTLKKRQNFIFAESPTQMSDHDQRLLALSAQIVTAFAGHNEVRLGALPDVIRNIYNTLAELSPADSRIGTAFDHTHSEQNHVKHDQSVHAHSHADNVYVHPTFGQTVFGDHLICMEDGLSMKMLKRHILTVHGMTPDEYRAKWGLPESYPMVASEYAKLRSSLALQSGLGLKPEDRSSKGRKSRRG